MLLQFDRLKSCVGLTHAVTSRRFGGDGEFNLADHVGTGRERAIRNRQAACERLGLDVDRLTVAQQVHQVNVAVVTAENAGRGRAAWSDGIPATDAMVTDFVDTPLMVLSADCPLILLFDPARRTLGVIHASWRCTFGGIIPRTVKTLADAFHSRPGDLWAGIGPGAGPCCYEVDDPFIQTISTRPELLPFVEPREGRRFFNLWAAGRDELLRSGLAPDHIEAMGRCTICDDRFFSFRRQADRAGRFGLIAAITSER